MVKVHKKVNDLKEADFREIKNILEESKKGTFTTEYIRKVCKGHRHNDLILETAENYTDMLADLKAKLSQLS
jgi:hypothetical protein